MDITDRLIHQEQVMSAGMKHKGLTATYILESQQQCFQQA